MRYKKRNSGKMIKYFFFVSYLHLHASHLLSQGRTDVQQILEAAANHGMPITHEIERSWSTHLDVPYISGQIFGGILQITEGSINVSMSREAGTNRGLELWRLINKEWLSKSILVLQQYKQA